MSTIKALLGIGEETGAYDIHGLPVKTGMVVELHANLYGTETVFDYEGNVIDIVPNISENWTGIILKRDKRFWVFMMPCTPNANLFDTDSYWQALFFGKEDSGKVEILADAVTEPQRVNDLLFKK